MKENEGKRGGKAADFKHVVSVGRSSLAAGFCRKRIVC